MPIRRVLLLVLLLFIVRNSGGDGESSSSDVVVASNSASDEVITSVSFNIVDQEGEPLDSSSGVEGMMAMLQQMMAAHMKAGRGRACPS